MIEGQSTKVYKPQRKVKNNLCNTADTVLESREWEIAVGIVPDP